MSSEDKEELQSENSQILMMSHMKPREVKKIGPNKW